MAHRKFTVKTKYLITCILYPALIYCLILHNCQSVLTLDLTSLNMYVEIFQWM